MQGSVQSSVLKKKMTKKANRISTFPFKDILTYGLNNFVGLIANLCFP
jgi:hypothetical protein